MAEDTTTPVEATVVNGSTSETINVTMDEARQSAPVAGPTPEKLGVSQAQFDKFYDTKTGSYNWQAHAREQEFIAQQRGTTDTTTDTPKEPTATDDAKAKDLVEKAGLDWNGLGAKISATGTIDDSDREALRNIGIPDEVVEGYIAGVTLRAEHHVNAVFKEFGGEKEFEQVKAYAESTLQQNELDAFTHRLGDPNQYKAAAAELMALANKTVRTATPNTVTPAQSEGYKTQAEMSKDMRDPRYKTDPAFREQVYAKAKASSWNMNPRQHTAGL